ncbi:hydrolase [Colletotrichum sojae]|uniref:Hydrolase n=1 Tax=Colletotrichum sojae TaxID=2175907 RepID=A0A8H6MSE2_9PEZI|nr:hydrolase [Colletotrichum sojae]
MASTTPAPRSWLFAVLDRLAGWGWGLPAETCSYTTQPVTIPLPDGVVLAGDVYQPVGRDEALGTILIRGPYGRSFFFSVMLARIYAARGYVVLFVSCRGTFGSGGDFVAGRTEAEDGRNVVAWMRDQPWYTGTFATAGASYLAFTQWALLADDPLPEDYVAAVAEVSPHDLAEAVWGTGAYGMQTHVMWSDVMMGQETRGGVAHLLAMAQPTRLDALMASVPLEPALRKHFADSLPWVFHDIAQPDITVDTWMGSRLGRALEKADVPVLLSTRWHDVFLEQTMEQYNVLSRRGCPVALRIAPGCHTNAGSGDIHKETYRFFEKHLARKKTAEPIPAVRIFRGGDSPEWLEMPKWPPATSHKELFLAPDGKLDGEQSSQADVSSFTFDPANPTPTVGGPLLFGGGSRDDTSLSERHDVVTFTTEPLKEPLDIMGRPSVDVVHSSDNPFCDLFVRLSVVDPKGRSTNVTEQYRRIDAGRDARLVAMDMSDTAYRVPAGSRVRLIVAGGCFPRFGPNLGAGENQATGTVMRPARHSVHFGGDRGSCLILPVVKAA